MTKKKRRKKEKQRRKGALDMTPGFVEAHAQQAVNKS